MDTVLGTGVFDDLGDADGDGIPDAIQFAAVAPGEGRVDLIGGSVGNAAYAMIGHGGYASGNTNGSVGGIDGHIGVAAYGEIVLQGGSFTNAFAQIGHRLVGILPNPVSGDIDISSDGGLTLLGGDALQAFAHIGHGGINASAAGIGGAIQVSVAHDITAVSGLGGSAYSQIGHGGTFTDGDMQGEIAIDAGGSIELRALNSAQASYAKFGHGDDLRGVLAPQGGTGTAGGRDAPRSVVVPGSAPAAGAQVRRGTEVNLFMAR